MVVYTGRRGKLQMFDDNGDLKFETELRGTWDMPYDNFRGLGLPIYESSQREVSNTSGPGPYRRMLRVSNYELYQCRTAGEARAFLEYTLRSHGFMLELPIYHQNVLEEDAVLFYQELSDNVSQHGYYPQRQLPPLQPSRRIQPPIQREQIPDFGAWQDSVWDYLNRQRPRETQPSIPMPPAPRPPKAKKAKTKKAKAIERPTKAAPGKAVRKYF